MFQLLSDVTAQWAAESPESQTFLAKLVQFVLDFFEEFQKDYASFTDW